MPSWRAVGASAITDFSRVLSPAAETIPESVITDQDLLCFSSRNSISSFIWEAALGPLEDDLRFPVRLALLPYLEQKALPSSVPVLQRLQHCSRVQPRFQILPFLNVVIPVTIPWGMKIQPAHSLVSEVEIFAAVAKAEVEGDPSLVLP